MEPHPLNPDAKALEEAFFARENARLLQEMRARHERTEQRAAIKATLGQVDDETVDHLLELGLQPQTVLALAVVPLALVAWADGEVQAKERQAILAAAADKGIADGSPAHALLTSWLASQPGADLMVAWKRYIGAMWPSLTETERDSVRSGILDRARAVAEAAGGFLGLGSKVSAAEKKVLDELASVLP